MMLQKADSVVTNVSSADSVVTNVSSADSTAEDDHAFVR